MKKRQPTVWFTFLYGLLILMTHVCTIQSVLPITITPIQTPSLIQSNHFFSTKQTSINYNIVSLNKSLPVYIIPKNQPKSERILYDNKITLTLNDNKGNYITCKIQDSFGICLLDKFVQDKISLIIQCEKLPCQFKWSVLQTNIDKINDYKNTQKTSLKQLYQISPSHQIRHLTIKTFCESPQLQQQFVKSVHLYANHNLYHEINTSQIKYYLFRIDPIFLSEYFYLSIQQKFKSCAQIQIFTNTNTVQVAKSLKDFIIKGESTKFKLNNPSNNFRIDAAIRIFNQQKQTTASDFNVRIQALTGGIVKNIARMKLQPKNKRQIEFSFSINKVSFQSTNLQLIFQSTQNDVLIDFTIVIGQLQLVQKGEYSFFSLKKNEKIKYKLVSQNDAPSTEKVFIFASDQAKTKLSKNSCSSKDGCQFQLEALQDIDGSIYLGQGKDQNKQQVIKSNIDKSFTKRVHQDSITYLVKKVLASQSYQILTNTHNVILYASVQSSCPTPSLQCHSHIGNSHHPFIFQSDKQQNFIIAVHALDQTQFTVSIVEQGEYPMLSDGVPFIYLMDKQQDQIIFTFYLPANKKDDLSFTLVSPINQLTLNVFNTKKLPKHYEKDNDIFTIDGYVFFPKKTIKEKEFYVVVRKLDPSKTEFIHFTIIASTKSANIKLENGVTHNQKLTSLEHQQFVLQFNPNKKSALSFYVHNSIGQKVNISLQLSKDDKYTKETQKNSITINKPVESVDISQVSKELCFSQSQGSCEIFLRIQNHLKSAISLQITLISIDSIIQVQDGVWQYFPSQQLTCTTQFYFFPKHLSNPINIVFKSTDPNLHLLYSLKKIQQNDINPEMWIFPSITNKDKEFQNLLLRRVKHFTIDKQALKQCVPGCLLLLSLVKIDDYINLPINSNLPVDSDLPSKSNLPSRSNDEFGLLVSSNILLIPQKSPIQVTLQKDEFKYMLIPLQRTQQSSTLTTYIYTALGSVSVYGNVCSQKNLRMPTNQQYDFNFGSLETQYRTETINKRFQEYDIAQDEAKYFCLLAKADQSTRFSIQYTSDQQIVNLLAIDEYKNVRLDKGEPKYFQIQGSVENSIKIVRTKGFPFIDIKTCTGKETTYDECLDSLKQSQHNKAQQLIAKVKKYDYKSCQKCIIYLKISSQQPVQVDVHLQSHFSVSILQQKKILTDYIEAQTKNNYQITSLTDELTYININVLEGSIKCKLTDFGSIDIQRTSDKKDKSLQIVITPQKLKESKNKAVSMMAAFALEQLFTTLNIQISSADPDKGATYTIQYSSGARQAYLQDGLVYNYRLQGNNPKTPAKFYYQNFNQNSHVYIFLGTQKSSELSKLYINIYSMQSLDNEQSKVEINRKIPQMRKKTSQPTILYSLPTYKFYMIQIKNPTGLQIQISLGLNHQQVIYLPYLLDYPFPLQNHNQLNFIINVQAKGYILLILKKCSFSQPLISYTFDYESFKNQQFQFQSPVNDQPKAQILIKAKKAGPLYVNVKRDELQAKTYQTQFTNDIFSLYAKYSNKKMDTTDFMQPGNKGIVNYNILGDSKIQIQFYEVACQSKSQFCSKSFQYFMISSFEMADVYSQSVCPTTYFADMQQKRHKVLPLRKIIQKPIDHKIIFTHVLEQSAISYIAIKAIYHNQQGQMIEIYYQPIEVVTIWGQLEKAKKHTNSFAMVGAVSIVFLLLIICFRRKTKGYSKLSQTQ